IEKLVLDGDAGAVVTADRLSGEQSPSSNANPEPLSPIAAPADRLDLSDGGDAGQRLTSKAEGSDRTQLLERAQLTRCVTRKRDRQVCGLHALAVIHHLDQALAGGLDPDGDPGRAGI